MRGLDGIKTIFRTILDRPTMLAASSQVDRALVRKPRPGASVVAVLAAPGAGNIGDHAMLHAFLDHHTSDDVVIVGEIPGVYDYLASERVRVLCLPALLNGRGWSRVRALLRFSSEARRFVQVAVIGADMMDGGYGRYPAYRRWSLAGACARRGISTRILGFSLSSSVDPAVLAGAVWATRVGVVNLLRDPLSLERAKRVGLHRVHEVRDVVFARRLEPHDGRPPAAPSTAAPMVIVNVSGLVGNRIDQVDDFGAIVGGLLDRGFRVVLLPHVLRASADDRVEIAKVARLFEGDRRVEVIDRQLAPTEVSELASRASLVITGRMHLAILGLTGGTPAIVLSTQGKVEGLLTSLGIPEGCIEPAAGMSKEILSVADRFLAAGFELRQRLTVAVAEARVLAERNFEIFS